MQRESLRRETHPVAIFACVACGTTEAVIYLRHILHPVLRSSVLSPYVVCLSSKRLTLVTYRGVHLEILVWKNSC